MVVFFCENYLYEKLSKDLPISKKRTEKNTEIKKNQNSLQIHVVFREIAVDRKSEQTSSGVVENFKIFTFSGS